METTTLNTTAPSVEVPRLVRPEFVAQMEVELQANQHKGDWRRWYPTPLQVLAEIQHHQGKLMLALSSEDCERVKEYSADLANFAMKVYERFGGTNSNNLLSAAELDQKYQDGFKDAPKNLKPGETWMPPCPRCGGVMEEWDAWLVTGASCPACKWNMSEGSGCLA